MIWFKYIFDNFHSFSLEVDYNQEGTLFQKQVFALQVFCESFAFNCIVISYTVYKQLQNFHNIAFRFLSIEEDKSTVFI